jgi:hypothetical protein
MLDAAGFGFLAAGSIELQHLQYTNYRAVADSSKVTRTHWHIYLSNRLGWGIAEMLDDPAHEIFEVIRWFGERGKIFNVHFRNIKGKMLDFMEAFPDEGDMDMARSVAAYHDVGYPYMLMPHHVPQIDGRDPSGGAFAYCYGYIQALLDALVPRPWPYGC